MNNFFSIALERAAQVAGKRGRMMLLLSRLALKLREVNWERVSVTTAKEKFFVLGRLMKAYALGQYTSVPWRSIILVIAAILYFVNPFDLIPDIVPVAGLTDDLSILLWVYNTVQGEIRKFIAWEKTQLSN